MKQTAQGKNKQGRRARQDSSQSPKRCINCGRVLQLKKGVWFCLRCNSDDLVPSRIFIDYRDDDEYVFIECPGATLYAPGTYEVVAGVKWRDDNDPSKGYDIVKHPVFAPNHTRRRRIRKEALGKIRRCQACQDYTVRMRRKEGPDFFIPSPKYPGRTKLKPVTPFTTEPR
jgi:hypothetical protein